MTRSVSFPRLTAANVPVLNPRSVFVVFINEVTNASRRVITWPRDPRVSFFSNTRAKRQKKNKKRNTQRTRKRKKARKEERKKESKRGEVDIHAELSTVAGIAPGTRPIRPAKKLPGGRGGGLPELPAARGTEGACARFSREIRLERLFSWLQLSHLAAIVCRSAQNSAPTVRIYAAIKRACAFTRSRASCCTNSPPTRQFQTIKAERV